MRNSITFKHTTNNERYRSVANLPVDDDGSFRQFSMSMLLVLYILHSHTVVAWTIVIKNILT